MKAATLAVLLVVLCSPAAASAAGEPETVQDKLVAYALKEIGRQVREVPAKSNTSRAIRRYHTAVPHARPDEAWCTIFVSYVAEKAGFPLGRVSQGIWEPKNLYLWAKSQGWYFPRGARKPKIGDLAVHGYSHTGIVVRTTRKGVVYTADANWGDSVKYNLLPLSASGFIRLPSEPRTG
jgi:hypothetical protein